MKIFIVSGLSGSGKSVALDMLEDLDFYCIDNMPLPLLAAFTPETLSSQYEEFPLLAVGIDARTRGSDIAAFPGRIQEMREAGIDIEVVFFQADRDVILRRFSETRRKHPLTDANTPLAEAIEKERELLKPISDSADHTVDTSNTNIHQLRDLIRNHIRGRDGDNLSLLFQSFGFKYGMPEAVDFVFDVRCLPNPHWHEDLRAQTGRDRGVAEFLEQQEDTGKMLQDIISFLENWLPKYRAENRAYVTVAIGCTGGKHRSVYLVEKLTEHFRKQYPRTLLRHTELP